MTVLNQPAVTEDPRESMDWTTIGARILKAATIASAIHLKELTLAAVVSDSAGVHGFARYLTGTRRSVGDRWWLADRIERLSESMVYGIYQSAAGLQLNQYRQEILANNLANLETAGFKHDLSVIQERLRPCGKVPGNPVGRILFWQG